ncbi:MAG TPA: DedA family protein [Thermoanaerobaculia bacterium]|jgi:membrane protein DedA with SNARE-associated domain
MSPEALLTDFGYLAVFIGTFLEGEAILITAGFFAARGNLSASVVAIVAFLGAYLGHIFWFWLGRRHGVRLLDRFPRMKKHFGRGIRIFERYGAAAIVITQWLYGLRITCAVIIGMSRISLIKFLAYEGFSCAAWAVVITAAGYYFGRAVERLLGRVENIEKYALAAIVIGAVAMWAWHQYKDRKQEE